MPDSAVPGSHGSFAPVVLVVLVVLEPATAVMSDCTLSSFQGQQEMEGLRFLESKVLFYFPTILPEIMN